MTVALPKPIDAYFAASNSHDAGAIARAFAVDGVVYDEGKVHSGRAAIVSWAQDTIDKYRTVLVPLVASGTVVKTKVSGTFPGSPIELTFNFEIGRDEIRSLKIG